MNKKILFTILAGAALVGCNKNINPDVPPISEGRPAEITFNLSTKGVTKATVSKSNNEAKANIVDLFVFNADGKLDAYGRWTAYTGDGVPAAGEFMTVGGVSTNEIDDSVHGFSNRLGCSTGAGKKIYAILNASWSKAELELINSEAALQELVFTLGTNRTIVGGSDPNVLDNFQMIGYATKDFKAGKNTVEINVEALVARVVLKKITKNFTSPGQRAPMTIKRIYMSNVVGNIGFGDGAVSVYKNGANDLWYNRYGFDSTDPYVPTSEWPYESRIVDFDGNDGFDTDMNDFLYHSYASAPSLVDENATPGSTIWADGTALASGDASNALVFYVMPNQVPWGVGDPLAFGPQGGTEFSPRHTRLIVEVEYNDTRDTRTYYYSIPIAENGHYPMGDADDNGTGYNGIVRNYSYEIEELVITRLGSRNPDQSVLPADVQFSIEVNPWTLQLVETETGKYVI